MTRILTAMLFGAAMLATPVFAATTKMTTMQPTNPFGFVAQSGLAQTKVNCGASNEHYALCTKIKATCDKIHDTNPNHGCGCTTTTEGNLGSCNTGPT